MKKVLAITGGIGSGKSYVVKIFSAMGIPVYDADMRTKMLYDSDKSLLGALVGILGDELVKDGRLDKAWMASRIFNDKKLLSKVEETVFPFVLADMKKWALSHKDTDAPFVILESAIFLEKPFFSSFADKVATVSCPLEKRIERVMNRSCISKEDVLARVANQWTDQMRESRSDFIIVSDFEHALLPQVYDIYMKMKDI